MKPSIWSEIRRREITTAGDARRIYGVDLAITGSAKSQDNRIQFKLQLVDAASSRQIDASAFEYDPAAPREAIDRAVEEVARMLGLKPAPQPREQTTTAYREPPDTYSAYLEGRGFLSRYDRERKSGQGDHQHAPRRQPGSEVRARLGGSG